ncbi:MAG: HEAT repeat domain-containing protein [Asgard group archaeon]|nr:HEAT repeat domain-containing protein [Asgard group archaeon]
MAEDNNKEKSSASLNGESDLEGKIIIDSNGTKIGICKAVNIGEDGQIGLTFETEINGKPIIPSKTIPYSAISKITDVIELRVPLNIKVAQSIDEIKIKSEELETTESKEPMDQIKEVEKEETKIKQDETIVETKIIEEPVKTELVKESKQVNVELLVEPEKLIGTGTIETPQADATEQLSKTLVDDDLEPIEKEIKETQEEISLPKIKNLMSGLVESIEKLEQLFKLVSDGEPSEKIEAIKALTHLTKISPEIGVSLIRKMLRLSDEQQQEVRLAIAHQLEEIGENNPELFKGHFLEILENSYDEPIEEVRDQLSKALHNIAIREPTIASDGLEEFLEEVIIGKRVPEVPSKVLHDVTLKVVSGNFLLTRISIKVRLKFIMKGDKLAEHSAEELEDYNATLIGLTIIESFTMKEAEKIIKNPHFKKLVPIFVEVILQMIEAYKEGSFKLLEDVVDKKIEIPTTVIERFYEIKINKTLEGVKNVPLEVFLENSIVTPDEAEQIIFRLVVQKRINAAITMNNGRTFITSLDSDEMNGKQKPSQEKPKTAPKKAPTKKTTTKKVEPKATTSTKKTTSSTKKSTSTTKKQSSTSKITNKKTDD